MSGRGRATLCLSMIVRDQAHLVREALDCAVPHIDYWVAVDAGSRDRSFDTLASYLAATGVPGELHERPWCDFATNRNQALRLCAGKADYIWVLDAHDVVVGSLELGSLEADAYLVRYGDPVQRWRPRILRSSLPWRFMGAAHAWLECDQQIRFARLEGSYHVHTRREPAPELERARAEVNAGLLREQLDCSPEDAHATFYLAQSYFDAGDHVQALECYRRRAEMGGADEEVFHSLLRGAECLKRLGAQSTAIVANYLRAWQLRPDRAEPPYEMAVHYRGTGCPELAEIFARRAAQIPFPADDLLFVDREIYSWRAADELALAAYRNGGAEESFALWRSLLDTSRVPDHERSRLETNAHFPVPRLLEDRLAFPQAAIRRLGDGSAPSSSEEDSPVTLTVECVHPGLFERTVNSFLNCCTDLQRISRWVCLNRSSDDDARRLAALYPFFEFIAPEPAGTVADELNRLVGEVRTAYWLHLEEGREFFWRGLYLSRALEILETEPRLGQVAFNRNYAATLAGRRIVGGRVRHSPQGWRYLVHVYIPPGTAEWDRYLSAMAPGSVTMAHWPHFTLRPSVLRTEQIRAVGGFDPAAADPEREFALRYASAGLETAFFDAINYRNSSPLARARPARGARLVNVPDRRPGLAGKKTLGEPLETR